MNAYIGAIDLGTTSIRFVVFDRKGRVAAMDQMEHAQIFPRPGWVEHDPMEIWRNTQAVIRGALGKSGIPGSRLAAVGVANQRETVVAWDRATGRPYCNAVVWQCTRSAAICAELAAEGGQDRFRSRTGLPIATYFSGPKIRWILDNVPEARDGVRNGRALMGTIETWVIWWLTGGPRGGAHVTDVTNASRTLLMSLETLQWDEDILKAMDIPRQVLPRIVPSIDPRTWGHTLAEGPLGATVPVCAALGDQQAALVGQACFDAGEAKNTYGTGCFLLMNTGGKAVPSSHGLLTTVAYQVRGRQPVYCLEGSIAIGGALVQWLRDNLGLIARASEIEALAQTVEDNGGVYIVPAFSGLFAPHWKADARGVIVGLTRYANKGHLARAALEAAAYQTRDIVEAMNRDSGVCLRKLKVDGGMVVNDLLLQIQADILDVPVVRPRVTETTALGAAYGAGLAAGFWSGIEELRRNWREERTWHARWDREQSENGYRLWHKAVQRTFGWSEP